MATARAPQSRRVQVPGSVARDRLTLGWFVCAGLIGVTLLVGEYAGPLAACASAVMIAGGVLIWAWDPSVKHRPPPGASWLILLAALGCFSAVIMLASGSLQSDLRDITRDVLIILSSLLFFVVGHRFSRRWDTSCVLLGALVIVGTVVSLVQIALFVEAVSRGVQDLYVLRLVAGRGSIAQLCAVVAVHMLTRDMPRSRLRTLLWIMAAVCLLSIVLTLSRLVLLLLLIFGLIFAATKLDSIDGRTLVPATSRALLVILGSVLTLSGVIFALQFISREAYEFVWTGFVEKLLNSWTEVATTEIQTLSDLNANYRAFESGKAMEMFRGGNWFAQWVGHGWGANVPLGMDTASSRDEFVRVEAAFLHNGYINYLVKTGVIGAALYVAFLSHLAALALWGRPLSEIGEKGLMRRQALLATVLALAAGSVIAGGLAFPAGFLSIALLLGLCAAPMSDEGPRRAVGFASDRPKGQVSKSWSQRE